MAPIESKAKGAENRKKKIRAQRLEESGSPGKKIARHYALFESLWELPPAVAIGEAVHAGDPDYAEEIRKQAEAMDYWGTR